jgi:hypothetical protein
MNWSPLAVRISPMRKSAYSARRFLLQVEAVLTVTSSRAPRRRRSHVQLDLAEMTPRLLLTESSFT